ncbi:hypothetical protein [Magnetospirillum sp. ME-1]|nr:hypothetical protein [Magnetospirillum sp. ME-1]
MVKNGEVNGTREELMGAINEALEQGREECPWCAKNRDHDWCDSDPGWEQ